MAAVAEEERNVVAVTFELVLVILGVAAVVAWLGALVYVLVT